jgi:hypothetical protein
MTGSCQHDRPPRAARLAHDIQRPGFQIDSGISLTVGCGRVHAATIPNDRVRSQFGRQTTHAEEHHEHGGLPTFLAQTQREKADMNRVAAEKQRFRSLGRFGQLISAVGWVAVAVGALAVVLSLSQVQQRDNVAAMLAGMGVMGGLGVAAYGFLMVVSGQSISCFVSIENNTHALLVAQRKTLDLLTSSEGGGGPEKASAGGGDPNAAEAPIEIGEHLVAYNGQRYECRRCGELRPTLTQFHDFACVATG